MACCAILLKRPVKFDRTLHRDRQYHARGRWEQRQAGVDLFKRQVGDKPLPQLTVEVKKKKYHGASTTSKRLLSLRSPQVL